MNTGVSIYRQMQQLPLQVANLINKADAIAYALNRLPPLYATTEEGWTWQQERARETQQHLICQAASWGLRAAQRQRKGFYSLLQQPQPFQQLQDDNFEPKKGEKKVLKLLAC